jgi:protein ImuB
MRDVRTLRTLALLDLESHPPAAAIDRVTIVIDPTPGRVLQHRLFTRAHPTPEQLSTLVARLGALMGQDRFGAPATVDAYRPGAFAMTPFKTDGAADRTAKAVRHDQAVRHDRPEPSALSPGPPGSPTPRSGDGGCVVSALRRCRQPVPARVAVADGRPVRVTTDRRGFAGGAVVTCAGPWRTSGDWWKFEKSEVRSQTSDRTSDVRLQTSRFQTSDVPWNRDEWDVSLSDGAIYRLFRDRDTDGWFIDAIVD